MNGNFEEIQTDLRPILEKGQFKAFAHGCNCFNSMGAGIARTVRDLFPAAWAADCETKKGDRNKLGHINYIETPEGRIIINAYTQFHFGGKRKNADYDAIASCFREIAPLLAERGIDELSIPRIGAGLAGGDWNAIKKIIMENMPRTIKIKAYYL